MPSIEKIVAAMKNNRCDVRFSDCLTVCTHYFGQPVSHGTSHHHFRTPWKGEPWVNIQNKSGKAKPYQVKQVLDAIAKLEGDQHV